jgi:hypothetical protein
MAEPIFMKLGMYIMTPVPISTANFIYTRFFFFYVASSIPINSLLPPEVFFGNLFASSTGTRSSAGIQSPPL